MGSRVHTLPWEFAFLEKMYIVDCYIEVSLLKMEVVLVDNHTSTLNPKPISVGYVVSSYLNFFNVVLIRPNIHPHNAHGNAQLVVESLSGHKH